MGTTVPQLFVSYAHIDNQKIEGSPLGWVDRFHEGLEMELEGLGLDFRFWRDKRDLEKDGFFDDDILDAVAESQVLVAVVSPVYPKRPYCLKELNHFVEKSAGGLPTSVDRVIKVIKQPLEDSSSERLLPEYLDGRLGFRFYSIDRQENRIIRFIFRSGEIARKNEYWDTISDLARSVRKHLEGSVHDEEQGQSEICVYLAETSSDEDASYRTVRAELEAMGVRILPAGPLSPREEQAISSVDADLERADFSVHLLGERSGYIPEGRSATPIVQLQLERAALQAKTRSDFSRLIWARPKMQAAEEGQVQLLRELADGTLLHQRDEFVRETLELFKNVLTSAVTTSRPVINPVAASQPRPIFLIYDRVDAEEGAAIRKALFELGHEVFRPDFTGDEHVERQAFEAFASQAEGVMVVYGKTHEAWVQQMLMRLGDWSSLGRQSKFVSTAVMIAGEPSDLKSDFLTRMADLTLDTTRGKMDSELQRFLDHLQQ